MIILIAPDDLNERTYASYAAPAGATVSIDEVEACLRSHPAVQAAAAAPTESPTGISQ